MGYNTKMTASFYAAQFGKGFHVKTHHFKLECVGTYLLLQVSFFHLQSHCGIPHTKVAFMYKNECYLYCGRHGFETRIVFSFSAAQFLEGFHMEIDHHETD